MKYPKRSQYKYAKSRYWVRNWSEYEAGLQRRGDLTVWLSRDALDAWRAPASGKPGGQRRYANIAIEAALTIRIVFHLPLRQTEGFLRCLAKLNPRTRSTRVAHAIRTQQAQLGRECCLPIQDDYRPKYAKSNLGWTTSRGTAGERDPQYDDPSRHA